MKSATCSYLANSPLVEQIQFTNDSTWVMSTTKDYDYLNRNRGQPLGHLSTRKNVTVRFGLSNPFRCNSSHAVRKGVGSDY